MAKTEKKSPLYTEKAEAEAKAKAMKSKGRDSDGAFRLRNRIDGK